MGNIGTLLSKSPFVFLFTFMLFCWMGELGKMWSCGCGLLLDVDWCGELEKVELFTFMWIVILIIYFVSSRLSLLFFFFCFFFTRMGCEGCYNLSCHGLPYLHCKIGPCFLNWFSCYIWYQAIVQLFRLNIFQPESKGAPLTCLTAWFDFVYFYLAYR